MARGLRGLLGATDRFLLRSIIGKHVQQMRDLKHALHEGRQLAEDQFAAMASHQTKQAHQRSEPRAVNETDVRELKNNFSALERQRLDLHLQRANFFAYDDAARASNYHDVAQLLLLQSQLHESGRLSQGGHAAYGVTPGPIFASAASAVILPPRVSRERCTSPIQPAPICAFFLMYLMELSLFGLDSCLIANMEATLGNIVERTYR
jgi:hypothetical protein